MSSSSPHERSGADLEAVAFGVAPAAAEQAVLEHCRDCPSCAAELGILYENVSLLGAAVPRAEMHRGHSAGIKSRLVSRAAAEYDGKIPRTVVVRPGPVPEAQRAEPRAPSPVSPVSVAVFAEKPRVNAWPYVVAAAAILAAGVATMQALRLKRERDTLAAGMAAVDSSEHRITELTAAVREKDELIGSLGGQNVRVMNLVNWEARARARMFWDRRSGAWTLFVDELRQPRPGKAFQVWMVTRRGRVPVGTFTPRPDGRALVQGRQPLDAGVLQSIAISEEPIGGSRAPTGPVVLAGGG